MRIAVCYNQTPEKLKQGEARDRIADAGSFTEAQAVHHTLAGLGHQAELMPLADDLVDFIQRLKKARPEAVFNLCEGFWGNARQEMHVAGLFEMLGIPFTGSSALCLGLSQDKIRTKALLQQSGLPTPNFAIAKQKGDALRLEKLKFPLIVKPPYEDASQGIEAASVVENKQTLAKRIRYIHEVYRQPALVEEFIAGRELNVSLLGGAKPKILPISEITFAASLPRPMVCFDSKWNPESAAYRGTKPVCPAVLSAKETLLIYTVAERAFGLLGCRDYARVDIRLHNNTPYILEINANPDISPDAGLARSAAAAGLNYSQLVEKILAFVSQRKEAANARP
jgi:D-alanine-D-alanine ligase